MDDLQVMIGLITGFFVLWSGIGILSEIIWMRFWKQVRAKYRYFPAVIGNIDVNFVMAFIAGPIGALITYIIIRDIRALMKKDTDNGNGDIITHIPDPDPVPGTPKTPALH